MHSVRQAAVAGSFYPSDEKVLASEVISFLDAVAPTTERASPKAIIVPHAGYVYSGQTAARAYACLSPSRQTIKRVILLGPVHRVAVRGLALPGVEAFVTPLGEIELDLPAMASLAGLNQVVVSAPAHALEHSLEVQLPFLQTVLDDFKLVPLAVGDATAAEVAEVLDALWGGPETLIVVSSDLSHFLPYERAQFVDKETVQNVLLLKDTLTHYQACGGTPINGLLLASRRHHLRPKLLELCNSGDTAGDKNRVVGYASFMFTEELAVPEKPAPKTENYGKVLIPIARAAIFNAFGKPYATINEDLPWLQEKGASFVTLTQNNRLRGCIGTLEAYRPLLIDVKANALAAAFRDPRFSPLTEAEMNITQIEVSLLSTMQALVFTSEKDALAQLRPGIDGLVFEFGNHRSTFLPQVWEQLPDASIFMGHLKNKAGLHPEFWDEKVKLYRYTVSKWKEKDVANEIEALSKR